jgi:hypothetical protein
LHKAGEFLSLSVPLIVFFAFQRYFVHGVMAGSVKQPTARHPQTRVGRGGKAEDVTHRLWITLWVSCVRLWTGGADRVVPA